MRDSILKAAHLASLLSIFAACSNRLGVEPMMTSARDCIILKGAEGSKDTITVALLDDVDPKHAPNGSNPSEELLFRHLYETLITVDCHDEVLPGLADLWERGEGGRLWTFEVRKGASYWDGTPVKAEDIVKCWQRGSADSLGLAVGIDSTAAEGDYLLHVYMDRTCEAVPRVLADPVFALVKGSEDDRWPLGTGFYRLDSTDWDRGEDSDRIFTVCPTFGPGGPVIRFVVASMSDERDLLGGWVDLMFTSDPEAIEYAESRPQFDVIALPWDRTYVLLSTSRLQSLLQGSLVDTIPAEFLDGLAWDAVVGDARGSRPPYWWVEIDTCKRLAPFMQGEEAVHQDGPSPSNNHRIIYDSSDPVARGLAERIVALGAIDPDEAPDAGALASAVPGLIGGDRSAVAEGVSPGGLARRLRNGDDFAYIFSVSRMPIDPCYETRRLFDQVPWLGAGPVDLSHTLLPLVDTRRHVIAARGRVTLWSDGKGDFLIANGKSRKR